MEVMTPHDLARLFLIIRNDYDMEFLLRNNWLVWSRAKSFAKSAILRVLGQQ